MTAAAPTEATPTEATRTEATRLGRWLGRAVRVSAALLLLGGLLGAALTAARSVPLPTVAEDLAAGRVSEVVLSDADTYELPNLDAADPGRIVRWKLVGSGWRTAGLDGGDLSVTRLPGTELDPGDLGASGDPASRNEAEIRRLADAAGVPVSASGGGAAHRLVSLSVLTLGALVVILIGAPQPRWATKWAWFWFLIVPGGLGALAWVAIEAPWSSRANRRPEPRPHREQPDDRRLTGGRALILSLVAGAVLAGIGTVVGNWLAG